MRDMEWFSGFPETEDEKVKEWLKNTGPFFSYNANVGFALCSEIKRREKKMGELNGLVAQWSDVWINILCVLREIRGKEWERPK